MKVVFNSFPIALRMIFKNPINLMLALFPTLIALSLYVFTIVAILKNSDYLGVMAQSYLPNQDTAGWVGKILTALFVLFIFLIMSWTFVLMVGIISAPFNSMLSARIEKILIGKNVDNDKKRTLKEVFTGVGQTFKDEFQKIFLIVLLTIIAFILNLFPFFYPLGAFILATLLAVQFVDYSWSRNNICFFDCLKDVFRNIIPYSGAGLIFLIMITVPIINSMVPAFATSYFTVLWLQRQNKLKSP